MREILPPITIRDTDYDYLSNLSASRGAALSEVRTFLENELSRASVVKDDALPEKIVTIGNVVTYCDLVSGKERTVMLVRPGEEDIEENRVSVLTPVGVALFGMHEGQVIAWETWAGTERKLMVSKVR